MIAVISGTTGLTGALLLSKLLSDSFITQVISVTRKSLEQTHPKLKEVIVPDFSKLSDYKEQLKGDIYFCCLGTTIKQAGTKTNFRKVDFDAIVEFGKVAESNDAKSLTVISAMGANPHSKIFYNQVKGETEQALLELKLNRLILMRPALLIGDRKASRPVEKVAITIVNTMVSFMPESVYLQIATPVDSLAARMLKEGKNPTAKIKIINAKDI